MSKKSGKSIKQKRAERRSNEPDTTSGAVTRKTKGR